MNHSAQRSMLVLGVGVSLAVALTGLAATGGAAPAVSGDPVTPSAARVLARQHRSIDTLDTTDRQAVADAYRARWLPAQSVATGWTGSLDGCVEGTASAEADGATLASINFARSLNGLEPVTFSADLDAKAQAAALMMAANDDLDHHPPASWQCFSPIGRHAAGASNLAYATPTITAGGAVQMYLTDSGTSNEDAGHRRWILDPRIEVMGSGLTDTTNALYVLGPHRSSARRPRWVSWPSAGYFPSQLEPDGRWSLGSSARPADFSQATVQVTRGLQRLQVQPYPVQDGYGLNTVVFQVDGADQSGSYVVTVSGIRGTKHPTHRYVVQLFAG